MWMKIGAAILRSRLFWVALASLFIGAYGFHMGNKHGANARAYAAVVAELRAKNVLLTEQLEEDGRIWAQETSAGKAADDAFSEAAPGLKKLIIDQKIADALNALIEE
jgi:hypothetical protein